MPNMRYKVTLKSGNTYRITYMPRYASVTVTTFDKGSKRPTSSQKAYLSVLMAAFVRVELIESVE